jgi:hypothetical protein
MHRWKLDAKIKAMNAMEGFKGKAGAEICIEHPISLWLF